MKIKSLEIFSACLVILDQVSKYFFVNNYPGLIHKNYGSAFSMPINQYFVMALSVAVIAMCFYFVRQHKFKHESFVVLMMAGTIGNLIDRVRLGYVIDFINVGFWPVFNLADVYLSLAIIYLFVTYFKQDELNF